MASAEFTRKRRARLALSREDRGLLHIGVAANPVTFKFSIVGYRLGANGSDTETEYVFTGEHDDTPEAWAEYAELVHTRAMVGVIAPRLPWTEHWVTG